MIFVTKRLLLRPWHESDAESLYEYAKDPDIGPAAGWPPHVSVENSREVIKTVLSEPETYAVCLISDNRAIGSIGFHEPTQTTAKATGKELDLGFWIGKPFWGNGYIPEAARILLRYAFCDLGCGAVWCGYYDGNKKSKRTQEKCGFIYHHTEKDKPNKLMGDLRTEHYNRLTKEEWESAVRL